MGIFRSTDPTTFDDVDGIVINESAPSPNIKGAPTNIAILVAQLQRGPQALTEVGSIGEFHEQFGKSSFGGNIALKNKRFGRLRCIRVIASDAALATKAFASSATDRITFSAKQGKGAYGNNIQVKIETGSTTGKKYTIHDANPDAVLGDEVYDNVAITAITSSTFGSSQLVSVAVNSTAAEPSNCAFTNLASGSDGAVVDTDYQAAIALAGVEAAGNVLFLDAYNATRNGYLKQHAADYQDKMCILAGAEGDSRATAVTDAANFRDADGRLIYAYPWVQTSIDGVQTMVSPASFMASLLSQIAPNIDPAYAANTQYLGGITDLKLSLSRADYIALAAAGISAFENDSDIGFKIKSGVVTQIADSSKIMILRRRMADYLTYSAAKFLKNYQNAPNSKDNRLSVKAALVAFVDDQERSGVLPKDSEVSSGKAKLIDTESLNTNGSIAAGYFKILWKQRIYSSMRFIVIQAQIGESVVVTEGESK
jgi:phage tail sheath protein FI